MLRIPKEKLEKRYNYVPIKTVSSATSDEGTTIYAKRAGEKVIILYYDNVTSTVLRQKYYSQVEIDTVIEVIDFLNKNTKSPNSKSDKKDKAKKKKNFIANYFNSLVKLKEQEESFYVK